MSTKYPGGIIRKTPPTITPPSDGVGGTAPGMWTLEQASYYTKQGTWPKPGVLTSIYNWGGLIPIDVSSPTQVGTLQSWSKIVCSTGTNAFYAIKQTGTLWSWGTNGHGQLGQNDSVNRSSPTQIGALTTWASVSGNLQVFAIKTDGTLWGWGYNVFGQLGLDDVISRSSPVQIGALTTWSQVSTGVQFSVAIKTDGTLWAWGRNDIGQLGQGNLTYRSSPVQTGALTNWSAVACGDNFSLAKKTTGELWSWGVNNKGQLGISVAPGINRSSPVQIGALTTWNTISTGNTFFAATTTSNTLFTCGLNDVGQLGTNTAYTVNRSSPVQVAGTTWSNAACGAAFVLALKTNNTIWSWGTNAQGQLGSGIGSGTDPYRSSPVQIGTNTNWYGVNAGYTLSAAYTQP